MLADLADQLLHFHSCGSEEIIQHIVATLRIAESGLRPAGQEVFVDEQAERRRIKDCERKRVVRARMRAEVDEKMSADAVDLSADTPSPLLSPYNPLITPHPSKKQNLRALPPDWKPTAEHARLAEKLGFDGMKLEIEAARMQSWVAMKGDERRADWDAFFEFWLRNGPPKAFKAPARSEKVIAFSTGCKNEPRKEVFVAEGTAQWEAWVAAGHKRGIKHFVRGEAGWHFATEWPAAAMRA